YNSIGPGAYTTVPPVVGETQADAESVLEGAGLTPAVDTSHHDEVPEGIVISTDPQAQTRVLNDSEVTVLVSLGPRMSEVPALVGGQLSAAEAALEDAGFSLGEVTTTWSDTIPEGEVLSMSPEAGEVVRWDTPIELEVSGGPAPITVPDVVGMKVDDAQEELATHALDVTVVLERTEDAKKGEVFRQSLEAGTEANRKDAITLTVSDGPPLVTVSDYVGMSVDQAERAAKDDGLKVTLYSKWPWSKKESIVDQSLVPGAQVEKNTGIVLVYN
ncbi:MAG: PASTA domain-containing protein, partial [Actinomycetes bacterium]|nr:PASTA domain-containing protein [Actinomycetes bacterium]